MNKEEIKLLLPDYLTGMLKEDLADKVSEAISSDPELREIYNELSTTAGFLSGIDFPQRDQRYWQELPKRIISIVRSEGNKKLWSYVSYKVFAAAAAVLLIITGYHNRDFLFKFLSPENMKQITVTINNDSLKTNSNDNDTKLTKPETVDQKNKKIIPKDKRKFSQDIPNEELIVQSTTEGNYEDGIENLFTDDSEELDDLTKEEEEKLIEEITKSSL